MIVLKLFSPAKINLFLRVVNKRSDGFHHLSSLFQAIDLSDVITFQIHSQDMLTCSDPGLPLDEKNLIIKALNFFRKKTDLSLKVKIHLEKCIPIEAGLGGGSSNAATALWAMNELTGGKIPLEQLAVWGAELGSDVPFFFSHGTAYCTGRGEEVQNLDALGAVNVCIVKPPFGLSTPEVFKRLSLKAEDSVKRGDKELTAFLRGQWTHFNDLEPAAFQINPELHDLKMRLLASGFQTVLLSGSGSSFFCLGPGVVPPDKNLRVYHARFINRQVGVWY